jgi:hypothetical protein
MAAESPGESFSTNKMTRAASFQRCIALVSKRRRQFPAFQRSEFSTYYDSQSGLHLPLHNEMEISVILDKSEEDTSMSSFVPAHLYKEDRSDMPKILEELKCKGVSGIILPKIQFPRDLRNLMTLMNIAPEPFNFFTSGLADSLSLPATSKISVMCDYDANDVELFLKSHVETNASTTISLRGTSNSDTSPIGIANRVATLIDITAGGNYIHLSGFANADDMVQMCEELMYLDVAGATVKSRLLVDSFHEEAVEETMLSGVNKFVIYDEKQIDYIQAIAKDQDKSIVR